MSPSDWHCNGCVASFEDGAGLSCLQLQFGDTSVSAKGLTTSLGWDSVDTFYHHDARELNMMLCEKLEEQMKVR